jgi:serine/threonine-protein kinase
MINKLGVDFDVVKVLDFGLVKNIHRRELGAEHATSEGVAAGTPGYLSPESVTGDGPVDARSDLYSLGCTAYFLLTGCKVFEATTPTACALAHIQKTPVPVGERSEMPVPRDLEAIVMQLLEKNPNHRIASARELALRLRALPCLREWQPERAEKWWAAHMMSHASKACDPEGWEVTATVAAPGPTV